MNPFPDEKIIGLTKRKRQSIFSPKSQLNVSVSQSEANRMTAAPSIIAQRERNRMTEAFRPDTQSKPRILKEPNQE